MKFPESEIRQHKKNKEKKENFFDYTSRAHACVRLRKA
jgi:hypothetical protein